MNLALEVWKTQPKKKKRAEGGNKSLEFWGIT